MTNSRRILRALPYRNVADFISTVIDDTLAKYEDWKKEREKEQ